MADSVVTVRDVFELPHLGSPEESSPRWQTLRQWMSEELRDVKSAGMEDVGAKIGELLELPIAEIFLASWKNTDALKEVLAESRKTPDAVTTVELADHTIKSQHHPHIEVRTRGGSAKKIEFTLRLLFKLRDFSLRIQNGAIKEMHSGPCEVQGTLDYQGLAVAEKKNAPIELPATVAFEKTQPVEVSKPAPDKISTNGNGHQEPPDKPAKALEPPRPEAPERPRPTTPILESPNLGPPEKAIENVAEIPPAEILGNGSTTEQEEEREQFVL